MVEDKNIDGASSVLTVPPIKFSKCGHNLKTNLDVVCETCDGFYISKSISFLISLTFILLIFYKKLIFIDYENSFVLYFLVFWFFLQMSVLRNRLKELFISFAVLIPTLIVIFELNIIVSLGSKMPDILVTSSYLLLFLFIIISTIYGFVDAKKVTQLYRRGQSFWVMLMFSLSVLFTVVYWLLSFIREASKFNYMNESIDKFFEITSPIYSVKSIILGIVFVITLLTSVIIAIKRYFTDQAPVNSNNVERGMVADLFITVGNTFSQAIIKFFRVILITLEEIWYLIHDSSLRLILIAIRILKVATIIGLVFIIVYIIDISSQLISEFWNETGISAQEPLKVVQLALIFIALPLIFSIFIFATYRNWFKYKFFKSLINKSFYTSQRNRILLEQRSIYKTIFTLFIFLFFLPVFIGWTIINIFEPINIGIIYIATLILTFIHYIIIKARKKKTTLPKN